MPNNVLAVVKYPKSDIVLPMIVRGGMLVEGAKILRPTSNREFLKLLPVADFKQSSKDALARHLEYHDASCEQFMQTIEEELQRHCDEDTAPPYKLLLPITPHAKKTRRARVRKSVSRRCTRSSRQSNLNLSIGKSLSQRQSTIKLALEKSLSLTTPNNTCLTKSIVVVTPEQWQSHRPSEQLNQYMPDVILSATPKSGGDGRSPEENHDKMNGIEHMESDAMVEQNDSLEGTLAEKQLSCKIDDAGQVNVDMEDADEEMEEVPSATPISIHKLISLHETLIEKQHVSSCIINSAVGAVNKDEHEEKHASPELTSKKGSQNAATEKRSADDQIRSCMKKNPVISLVKLGEAPTENSPQQNLVLNFEGSDEEDIADETAEHAMKMFEPVTTKDKLLKSGKPTIHKTPVRVGQTAARRSLVLKLRLSSSESELDSSALSKAADEDVDQHDEQAYALQDMPLQDSLEEDIHDDTMEKEHPSINTTSQASSSVCSSTAATVVLSEEEEQVDKMEAPAEVRRSMRTRGGHRLSVVTSIAAKRVSMSMKLKAKKQAAEAKTMKRVVASGSDDGTSSATSSESPKKRPKIVKPVLKSNCKLPKPSASGSSKRTRNAFLGSPGFQSPSQPKAKHMKCASPLCGKPNGSKTSARAAQRTRATFLNRSTAASRSRRTPTKSASSERTRGVLLMGSPYKFGGPSTCHTPNRGLGNLTVEVTSFIRRNTPQKVNPDEELAAKKQQLEEKQKREEQLKKKRDEEKLRKLAEKRKKRSMRLRKAAELREKREKEEKEKQLQKAEQWKKKLADANKVKVLRKKDETEKIKKLQKKQAEAEEVRRREEEERIRKIQEQEMEKDHRLQEKRLQKEHEALIKKQAEQEKMKERQRQDRIREEKEEAELQKKQEEEYLKREEEERAKQRMVEETARLRQIKADREEAERRKKLQEEETKRIAEAAKQEQLRLQKEEEAQQKYQEEAKEKQEELARKKEREELRLAAQKKKMEEAQALLDEKARKRKEEEMARAEELRQRREEMRKRAERKREEERLQVKEEKKRAEEQKKKEREEAEQEKMRQIQEANRKLRELEEQHRKEKERLQNMENNAMNRTYTLNPDQSELGSPQSYDITPHSHHYKKKNFAPSTAENYNIDDLASGDSTDDDMTPRKVVPRWAKGGSLRSVLVRQYYSPPDLRIVFRNALSLDEVQLHEIFRVRKPRYFHRTSSAQWNSPIMPPGHISFTEHCKGFD